MQRIQHSNPAPHRALLGALLAASAWPVIAADQPRAVKVASQDEQARRTEQMQREVERMARDQRDLEARLEMAQRERSQREALRGQEDAIRRLEEARSRLENSTREVADLSRELGRNYNYTYSINSTPPRALLGVSIDDFSRDRGGALVREVSPGGAAAEAGIKAGDVITSIAGEDLSKQRNPGQVLVEKMRTVEPDTKLKVGVLRDGRRMEFDVTARAAPRVDLLARNAPSLRVEPRSGTALLDMVSGNRLGELEFATVSERLGSYFGVSSGVLVVRTGPDSPYGLQDGDVILSIDGRTPTNAQHAGRILRSYQSGEKVKLRVQRDRKAIDVDTTVPGAAPRQRSN